MKKRRITIISLCLLVFLCLASLAACGDEISEPTAPTSAPTNIPTNAPTDTPTNNQPPKVSTGFEYRVNEDGITCTIIGIGTCTDTSLYIPATIDGYAVTEIGYSCFSDCTNLVDVTFSNSIKYIRNGAFAGCTGLTNITIPASVEGIQNGVFQGCTGLKSVYFSNGITHIGLGAFDGCTELTGIVIPESVDTILNSFSNCTSLASIIVNPGNPTYHSQGNCLIETETKTLVAGCKNSVIPSDGSVTSIGYGAFKGCTGLTSIAIPDSIANIDGSALKDCSGLLKIDVQNGNAVYHADGNCLIETETKTLVVGCKNSLIPSDGRVTSIGNGAFSGCTTLTEITIPHVVKTIGDDAFSNCNGLKNIIIEDGLEKIGISAFQGCTGLTSIEIPDSVTSIGWAAFDGCNCLASLTIPKSVTSIGQYAFRDCSGLLKIDVQDGNPVYHADGDCLIETESKTLILGCQNSVIPTDGSVTGIGSGAFSGCAMLTEIKIPNSVTSIDYDAFNDCTSLINITFLGSKEQWHTITKEDEWTSNAPVTEVVCNDGTVPLK